MKVKVLTPKPPKVVKYSLDILKVGTLATYHYPDSKVSQLGIVVWDNARGEKRFMPIVGAEDEAFYVWNRNDNTVGHNYTIDEKEKVQLSF